MYFLIEDDKVSQKYNTIWDKVSAVIKKKNVYNKELLKTQIKSHGDKITNFYNNKIAKGDSDHTCLAVLVY